MVGPAGRGWIPPVAPTYGGVDAQVLLLLRDPGPMTHTDGGSGLLSAENDDGSAQRLCELLDRHGIAQSDCVVWNAYPWYSHGDTLRSADFAAGLDPLVELLGFCPRLRVVALLGGDAQKCWVTLTTRPDVAARYAPIATFHTSNRAFAGVSRDRRAERLAQIDADFATIASLLD